MHRCTEQVQEDQAGSALSATRYTACSNGLPRHLWGRSSGAVGQQGHGRRRQTALQESGLGGPARLL